MAGDESIHPWVLESRGRNPFGLTLLPSGDWPLLKETAQAAEELGFDSIWLPDHPLAGFDSWTLLAALAEHTSRIRLGTMVTCVYYRHPLQLARVVADVDRISGGRAVLGIGSGDLAWEFEQMGMGFPPAGERSAALEEALRFMPALLRGETVQFEGDRFRVAGATLRAAAVQQPRIPILIAGGGPKTTLRLTAAYADASNLGAASWAGGAFTPEDAAAKLDALRARCAEAGRPFEAILRTTQVFFHLAESEAAAAAMRAALEQDPGRRMLLNFLERMARFCTPAAAIAHLRELRGAGYEYTILNAANPAAVERYAREIIPALGEEERAAAPA